MHHFHLSWDEVTKQISAKNLIQLTLSISNPYKKTEERAEKGGQGGRKHIFSAFDRAAQIHPKENYKDLTE